MRPRPAVASAAVLLLLTACSSSPEPSEGATPSVSGGSASPSEEPSQEPSSEPGETGEPETPASGGAECLVGSWRQTAADQEQVLADAMGVAGEEIAPDVSITGDSILTFDGSSYRQEYLDQTVSMSMDAGGFPVETVTTLSGTVTATYAVDGVLITVTDVDYSGYVVETVTLVNGEEVEIPIGEDQFEGMDLGGTVEFTCAGDELTMSPVEDLAAGVTVTYHLSRE